MAEAAEPVEPGQEGERLQTKPLTCPQCGGPVPLVDFDSTTCPYCGAAVPVPPELRALRAGDRRSAADHARIEALYRQLGAPPGPWLRAWAGASDGLFAALWALVGGFMGLWLKLLGAMLTALQDVDDVRVVLVILALPLAPVAGLFYGVAAALHALTPMLHLDPVAVFGPAGSFAMVGALLYLLIAVPTAIFHFGDAFASVRHRLQAAMAARPPARPGGPALCRHCGAALQVAAGALGARCDYCHCDNLVALPPAWVNAAKRVEQSQHREVGEALEEEREVRSAARWRLVKALSTTALVVPCFAGGGALVCGVGFAPGQRGWSTAVAGAHQIPSAVWPLWGPTPRYPPLPHAFDSPPLARGACNRQRTSCELRYSVPLRRSEVLTLETDSHFPDDVIRLAEAPTSGWQRGPDGSRLRFTAPYSGWFALRLLGNAMHPYRVGWSVQTR